MEFKGMSVKQVEKLNSKIKEIIEFDGLNSFYEYITTQPINKSFKYAKLLSKEISSNRDDFTKTHTFEEACELFKNGWADMSKELTQRLNTVASEIGYSVKSIPTIQVQGYHPVVPMYLNNQPKAMVNTKLVPVKQKVVTLSKYISYQYGVDSNTIIEESIKALQIVKKLESQGTRVNLNIIECTDTGYFGNWGFMCKIRIKSANERLNISKCAFTLTHPSMLRRLFHRFKEVYPNISSYYIRSYGSKVQDNEIRKFLDKGEYYVPPFIKKDITRINTLNDLELL